MKAEQQKRWQTKIKKLALSYGTGWEYLPESEEAGSILTDIFLDMELENKRRLGRIWEKQEQAFLQIVPEREEESRRLETALVLRTAENCDGQWLAAGTRAYAMTEQGGLLYFRTVSPLKLTAAGLNFVIRRSGLWAWLCYGRGDSFPISFLPSADRLLAHPVFRWHFFGAWDGHSSFSFRAEFPEAALSSVLPGSWTVSDGRHAYPAVWQQAAGEFCLRGDCPEFAVNLAGSVYELKLELSLGEELPKEWLKALTGGFVLKEAAADAAPELCLTDDGACGSGSVLPFGRNPEEGACFYLAFDRAAGDRAGELILQFAEKYETEEKLPQPEAKEYRKLYKKYPWLKRAEQVEEWQPTETRWEYFNGKSWHLLPDSEAWKTGCRPAEPGKRQYRFKVPGDMAPCFVEGEEHIYLRLRVSTVRGAYAPYYRKQIPVLEGICLQTGERRFIGEGLEIPEVRAAETEKLYLGFDREVSPDNCWYTGRSSRRFAPEQIVGRGERYGKEACWVELPPAEGETEAFLPNYVEVRQEPGEQEEADLRQIPEKTPIYLETEKFGVLGGMSVTGARYDKAGAPIQDPWAAEENFLFHFGRMLTRADMELLLQERYPSYQVADCIFDSKQGELLVKLARTFRGEACTESEEDRLPEIGSWLKGLLRQRGPLWLKEAGVRCALAEGEAENGEQGTGKAG